MFKESFEPNPQIPEVHETIGVEMRGHAINTLKQALKEPNSPVGQKVHRLHTLMNLLRDRMEKEGVDTSKEIKEVEALEKRLTEGSANEGVFKDKEEA